MPDFAKNVKKCEKCTFCQICTFWHISGNRGFLPIFRKSAVFCGLPLGEAKISKGGLYPVGGMQKWGGVQNLPNHLYIRVPFRGYPPPGHHLPHPPLFGTPPPYFVALLQCQSFRAEWICSEYVNEFIIFICY